MIIGERNTMGQFAEEEDETGLNHFEARLWDSRLGRWLTTDPAGQYASPYLGMGNNPIRLVDPDGKNTDDVHYDSKTDKVSVTLTKDNFDRHFIDGKLIGYSSQGSWKYAFSSVFIRPEKVNLNHQNPTTIRNQILDWFRYINIFKDDITKPNPRGFYLNDILDVSKLKDPGYDRYPFKKIKNNGRNETVIVFTPFDKSSYTKQENDIFNRNKYTREIKFKSDPYNSYIYAQQQNLANSATIIVIHTYDNHSLFHKFRNYIENGIDFRQ